MNQMELQTMAEVQPVVSVTNPTSAITVHNLVKRYKKAEQNAVDDISFNVAQGSFFALLGPNGAGKTTTISILTTMLSFTSGTVTIAGYDLVNNADAVRRHIGIIFQKPSLDLNLTAEENVRFHAVLYGLYPYRPFYRLMPYAYRKQVDELAQILGLEQVLFKPARTFSGGMKRKLEIMRSLLHRPSVLFLDEPTSGLDPESRQNLWSYLQQARKEYGTTVFLTTHYLEEVEQADDICIMNYGRIVAQGSPARLKEMLTAASLLIDADDRERLRAEIQHLGLPFTETSHFKIALDGQNIHTLLKQIETPLTLVHTHMPSLEDAYLDIIRSA